MHMSSNASKKSRQSMPDWFLEILGLAASPEEGDSVVIGGQALIYRDGVLRQQAFISDAQQQTENTFGFKWSKRDTYEKPASLKRMRGWLNERYGPINEAKWLDSHGESPCVLDAGCGAAKSGIEYWGPVLDKIQYIGAEISSAIDVAHARLLERNIEAGLIQADITQLPLPPESVDIIFSEGVLHHTDSTKNALLSLVPLLKMGGRIMFYVYKKKGPIREFTDDYIRDLLQEHTPEEAWELMMPLTKLGKILGDLNIEIEIPDEISLLDIPQGKINLQRLLYWHVFKAFHHPDLSLDELNHINYDWYAPANAYRQTSEEVRSWCEEVEIGRASCRERV